MQISLKDLLAIVAFCAGMAWCAAQFSYSDPVFWFACAASGAVAALFVRFSLMQRHRAALQVAIAVAIGSFLCYLGSNIFAFLPCAILGVLLAVVSVNVEWFSRLNARALAVVTMSCVLASFVVGTLPPRGGVGKLLAMRRDYPIVDLTNRLQYEQQHRPTTGPGDVAVSDSVSYELGKMEEDLRENNYTELLFRQVHSAHFEKFIRTEGFGVRRMIYVRAESLDRPALQNISLDEVAAVGEPMRGRNEWRAFWETGKSSPIEHLHKASRNDFVDSNAFGAVITKADVSLTSQSKEPIGIAGFIEHGMHFPPLAAMEEPLQWKIERLQLVSLLRFDEPRVYILDHLPRMDQLSGDDVPTRPLDEFESDALPKLRTEKDVVVTHDGPGYRMLGSLRAANQCLNCHSVQRGELLGAFSYSLRRLP